jgi:hypothetical protein
MSDDLNIDEILEQLSCRLDADIFLFIGDINIEQADTLVEEINSISQKHSNVALILSTFGGSPDAAYRIARLFKKKYKKFILCVFGHCKSAGTLIAVGADEIIMSEYGELGPLDMQVTKDDELINASSFDYMQILVTLKSFAFSMFEEYFLTLKSKSGSSITTKTASNIATSLTTGILAPIAEQIDPLRIGEVQRAINMAIEYGKRLNKDEKLLIKLTSDYPSHGFVIDFAEARELFKCVREPDDIECKIAILLHDIVREPKTTFVQCIFPKKEQEKEDECAGNERNRACDTETVKNDVACDQANNQFVPDNSTQAADSATAKI